MEQGDGGVDEERVSGEREADGPVGCLVEREAQHHSDQLSPLLAVGGHLE